MFQIVSKPNSFQKRSFKSIGEIRCRFKVGQLPKFFLVITVLCTQKSIIILMYKLVLFYH